ncbi:MAG TPA: hypothetical protein ENH84_02750 [Phycisphaerae bacterium]|nr:hypothetical protein [Phycisphaerae bacterium]
MPESDTDCEKRKLKELEGKNIAHYSVLLSSWIQTKMERDKTLVALSSGGIALLVTLLTTVGIIHWLIIILAILAFLCFGVCIWSSIKIYQLNSQHIENELKNQDSSYLNLEKYDKRSLKSFIFGVVFLCFVGITTASVKYINAKERKMAKEKETTLRNNQISKKSLNGLSDLKPEVVNSQDQVNSSQQQDSSNNSSEKDSGDTSDSK